ncbi:MAG: beta-propeller domain-containing protein [Deltaproteobacteria bacterium]|nr:beta-propeller domain-containing protein [Deltaproteobacteria bacterium]
MKYPLKNMTILFSASLAVAALWGCTESSEQSEPGDRPGKTAAIVAQLKKADSCEDLLTKIQDDAVAKITAMAEQQRVYAEEQQNHYDKNSGAGGMSGGATIGSAPFDPGVSEEPEAWSGESQGIAPAIDGMGGAGGAMSGTTSRQDSSSAPSGMTLNGDEESTGDSASSGPSGHSDTNVQVENVDEADIVKVDGETIYLLHGNQLFVLDAWPPEELSIGPDLSIEGYPVEMFVRDGRAVVYSRVYDNGELGSLGKSGNYKEGYYYDGPEYYCGGGPEFTKISLLDVTADAPKVVRELYIEGSYQSARLHDSMARTVVQGGFKAPGLFMPNIEFWDAWGRPFDQEKVDEQIDTWRDRVIESIQSTELSDWLPLEKERIDGKIVDVERRCSDYYAPSPGMTDYGLTNIVMLDITETGGPLSGASILGSVSEVYASAQTMLLAHQQWYANRLSGDDGERTALHSFELTADRTNYTASGFVPGHILNQFSMDVDDEAGVVRLATTRESWNEESRFDNRVFTLQADGDELKQLGKSEALGHRDERIFSTRFIGDKAYVVTFRQQDPLIVLDLSDPENPEVLGEAVIPGFSDYMHPLDKDHLLTIGRNTNEWGSDIGLLLQIFDVSKPTQPKQTHHHTYSPDGYSTANTDHKAFTYWAERQLLAFPFVNYGGEYYDDRTGSYYQSMPRSSLEVFKVSIDTGFTQLGSVNHTALMEQNGCLAKESYYDDYEGIVHENYYWQCSQPDVRRGVFMDDFVYAISHAGVTVHALTDLVEPVGQISLPIPNETSYCYGYDSIEPGWGVVSRGGIGGTPISVGTGGSVGSAGMMTDTAPPTAGTGAEIGVGGAGGSMGDQPADSGAEDGGASE